MSTTTTTTDSSSSSSLFSNQLLSKSIDIKDDVDNNKFPQGCQFSPDGLCVLSSSCNKLMLYNVQLSPSSSSSSSKNNDCFDWKAALTCETGNVVRSYSWYPYMNSYDPSSCCFAATSRDQPVHLYDAYNGSIRATYSPHNRLDELESPTIVTFSPNGQNIIMGGFRTDRMIQLFDLSRPGKYATTILKLGKTRKSKDGQKGLVSSISICPYNPHIFAIGTYSPGSIYLYDDRCTMTTTSTILCGSSSNSNSRRRNDNNNNDDVSTTTMIASDSSSTCIVGHGKKYGKKRKRPVQQQQQQQTSNTSIHDTSNDFVVENGNNDDDFNNNASLDIFSKAKVQWYQNRAKGGITQLEFSIPDQYRLYSSSRRSNAILAWDLRRISSLQHEQTEEEALYRIGNNNRKSHGLCPGIGSYDIDNNTNQRLEFTLDESNLYIGCRDNCIRIYNHISGKLVGIIDNGINDSVNGISLCSNSSLLQQQQQQSQSEVVLSSTTSKENTKNENETDENNSGIEGTKTSSLSTTKLLAVACGSRRFPSDDDWDKDDPFHPSTNDNTISASSGGHMRLYQIHVPSTNSS